MLSHAVIDSSSEQRRKKDEPFRRGHETERLIHVGAGRCWQMRQRDPHQHQPAKGIEFSAASHQRSCRLDTNNRHMVSVVRQIVVPHPRPECGGPCETKDVAK